MRTRNNTRAFTLVEILIVVVILGVLAAIVVPAFAGAVTQSKQAAFATQLNQLIDQAEYYMESSGEIIPDGSSGEAPEGFADVIDASAWAKGTPLGGSWDTEHSGMNFSVGLGVHFDDGSLPTDEQMIEVDHLVDDGNLLTGAFQRSGDPTRFYYVLIY